jgi:hypothetical protein
MNIKYFSTFTKLAVCSGMIIGTASLRGATAAKPQAFNVSTPVSSQFETVAFSDSAEAGMLHRAYRILATGDHDYKGHRVKAMHAVEAAAKLLGVDLSGDAKDNESQVLSDDKMREAGGLLQNVLGNAEVKGQPRVSKHITEAINQINTGLGIR